MSAPRRRHRRRTTAALLVAGLACAAAALFGAVAPGAQAQEFSSFDLTGGARGYTMYYEEASGMRYFEATVPEASSLMQAGPIGLGRAAVFWPGPVGGNAGSLVFVLQPDAPEQASSLNYPYRAESRIGDNPPEKTNTDLPGSTMKSSATPEAVTADARVDSSTGDPGTFGPSTATSASRMQDGKGIVESRAVVENISLAGGLVTIDSVVSTATATTDGTASDGAASTTVTGLRIAEQKATIDQEGLHIGEDAPNPVQQALNDAAKQAFEQAGAELIVSAPIKEVDGPNTTVDAGSLIFSWRNQGGYETIRIGGAQASVSAAPGFDTGAVDLGDTDLGVGESFSNESFDTGGVSATDSFDSGGFDSATAPLDTGTAAATPAATPALGSAADVLREEPVAAIRGAIGAGWVVFGIAASALLGLAFKRLADDVLAVRAAACPLSGDA